MKKSFMTRVLAVSLSAAMAFSMSSASNLMTASAASTVNLKTTFKTLKVNQTYKMTLKNNTLNWKITKVTTSNKKICTVYGKTASSVMLKGKGVGRAKITVKVKTTKRKYPKNIKLMKCTANVKAADSGQTTEALSATAVANSNSEVSVSFNQAIDGAEAANFAISDTVSVTKAELSADKKRVVLTIAGAEYGKNYDLTVSGIKVGGKEQAEQKLTFTTPAAENKYPMSLTAKDTVLKSDGQDQTVVTFTISDENGNLITDKGVEVAFTADIGKFAEQRVTIQDGKATVMYTSEALKETQSAKLTATVVEVPAGSNQELMGLSTTTSVTLTPNPGDTSIGALITSATAPTADRIIAYFNQEVKASDFKTDSGKVDFSKFSYEIWSGLDNDFVKVEHADNSGYEWANSTEHKIVGILDVDTSEKNALQLLVDTPMVDNTNVSVKFRNKNNTNSSTVAENTVYFKLTDARQPAVLSVKNDGLRKIVIEFSEAVLPAVYASGYTGDIGDKIVSSADIENAFNGTNWGSARFAADYLNNYEIDGLPLYDYWCVGHTGYTPEGEKEDTVSSKPKKTSTKNADVTTNAVDEKDGSIKIGSYKVGEDTRHVVTITVGRKQYLKPGTHSVSISNVGDWAAKTDRERNIVNTQTFDFNVASDDLVPTFTVTPQSPEQYLVQFNTDVDTVSNSDTIKTPNSASDKSILRLQQQVGGSWVDISDAEADRGKNPIRVSKVNNDKNEYIVEVTKDWTQVYDTIGTRTNYFNNNLRLHMDANTIVNLKNDKQNAEINVPLDGEIMKSADVVSPVIGEVVQAVDENDNLLESYNVTLSEPVKLSDGSGANTGANKEGLTPSQTQNANQNLGNLGVPAPSAQFIRVDNGQTIDGLISDEAFIDAEDTTINVEPSTALTDGDWRLVISSISDDYGNTASTLAHTFNVARQEVVSDFEVVWAAVSDIDTYNINNIGKNGPYIFVKFNKPLTRSGNSTNALVTANYTINGNTLPTGTKISANIKGYDEHSSVVDSITISLPRDGVTNNYWNTFAVNGQNTMLNISKAITCTTGATLANGGMIRLPFQYGAAAGSAAGDDVCYIESLNSSSDAVWGNNTKEQYGNFEKPVDYYKALKNALESNKYRKVILSHELDLENSDVVSVFGRSHTLTIKRAVDIDLAGNDIKGNVVVSTTDTVDKMTIKSDARCNIEGYAQNRENVPTLKVTAGNIKDFIVDNVQVARGGNGYAININDTYQDTFKINAPVVGDVTITDADKAGFEITGGVVNGKLIIDTKGEVRLHGALDATKLTNGIDVNQAGILNIQANLTNININVNKSSKDARIIVDNSATITNVEIHASTEVRVTIPAGKDIKLIREVGGSFKAVTKDNKDWTSDVKSSEAIDVNNTNGLVTDSSEKTVLEKLNVVTLALDGSASTVTWGAISPDALTTDDELFNSPLNLTSLKERIEGTDFTVDDSTVAAGRIKATYTLMSTSVATTKTVVRDGKTYTIVVGKTSPTKNAKDRIRVELKIGDQSVVKYIDIVESE